MPLQDPGQFFVDGGEEWDQVGGVGAAGLFGVDDGAGEGADALGGIPAGPAVEGFAGGSRIGDAEAALLGYVEAAAQTPQRGVEEIGAGVFGWRGDLSDYFGLKAILLGFEAGLPFGVGFVGVARMFAGDIGVDRVFLTLLRPGQLPVGALAQSGFLVAQHFEGGHGFFVQQIADQGRHVERGLRGVERGDGHKVGVALGVCSEVRDFQQRRLRPVARGFETIEQPALERGLFELVPFGLVPAPLVLGAFKQADPVVRPDQRDAALDQRAVIGRPARGRLSDRRGTMALEPG